MTSDYIFIYFLNLIFVQKKNNSKFKLNKVFFSLLITLDLLRCIRNTIDLTRSNVRKKCLFHNKTSKVTQLTMNGPQGKGFNFKSNMENFEKVPKINKRRKRKQT